MTIHTDTAFNNRALPLFRSYRLDFALRQAHSHFAHLLLAANTLADPKPKSKEQNYPIHNGMIVENSALIFTLLLCFSVSFLINLP
ncbi:MAG: hypothetical protein AB7P01_16535 [Bacteroidia bacterium]